MSTALLSSTPRIALDRTCINIVKAENQSCNVTEDNNNQSDCYESMHAFKKIRTSTSGLRKSPNKWTKEENQKLASLVSSYGEKKWKRISAEMGGQKTGAQCAQHWKRVLSPEIRKGHWDENEEDLLLRLVVQYGSCWKKIAKKIPQRTDIQCRYQYLKAKQSREVMWDNKEDESLVKKVMEVANCSSSSSSPSTAATTGTLPPISVSPSSPSPSSSPNLSSSPASSASPRSLPSPLSMTDSPVSSRPRFSSPSPLRNSSQFSPMQGSPSVRGKEIDDSSSISSGSGSGSEEEYGLKMSGEMGKFAWNDDKHNVNMAESTTDAATRSSWKSPSGNTKDLPLTESLCASCHSPFINHIHKVVWLEISEHMARLKLTSTLRTALECKTRFMELLGNKISFTPSQFGTGVAEGIKAPGLKSSGDIGRNGLGGSGGIAMDSKAFHHSSMSDANNIGVKINNNNNTSDNKMSTSPSTATTPSRYNGSNINLTNCNHNNITINITNSYTTNNTLQNGVHLQQLTHTPSNTQPTGLKPEPLMGPAQLLAKAPILSPAPPFPSFTSHPPSFTSHHSLPSSFPHLPAPHTLKTQPRNIPNGLDSLAAVASILPREMLADYF